LTEEQLRRFLWLTEERRSWPAGQMQVGRVLLTNRRQDGAARAQRQDARHAGVIYQILKPSVAEADQSLAGKDETVQPASFPSGILNPPVEILPARFECPYCFRAKEIGKLSDWTCSPSRALS
jgi:hypothetical protein